MDKFINENRKIQKKEIIGIMLSILAVILVCLGFYIKNREVSEKKSAPYTVYKQGNLEQLSAVAKERKNLVIGTEALSTFINPVLSRKEGDSIVQELIYESLVVMDKTGNPIPFLAKNMTISADGKTYSFNISDVEFSNGKKITLEDVQASFQVFCDTSVDKIDNISNPYSKWLSSLVGYDEFRNGFADKIEGIEIESNKISFSFKEQKFSNIWAFLTPIFNASAFEIIEQGRAYEVISNSEILGTGIYKLAKTDEGKFILNSNEHYKGNKPNINEVVLMEVNPSAAIYLFETGQIDIYDFGGNRSFISNLMQTESAGVYAYESLSTGILGINCRNELLEDVTLRQAIAYAINREELAKDTYGQSNKVPLSILPDSSWIVPANVNNYPYDREKAISILDKEGYLLGEDGIREKDGIKLEFTLLTYNVESASQKAEEIIKDLYQVGIQVNLEQRAYNNVQEQVFIDKDFDLYYLGFVYSDELELTTRFSEAGKNNAEGWSNRESEQFLEEITTKVSSKDRKLASQNFIRLLSQELPQIPIDTPSSFMMVSPRIKGVEPSIFAKWKGIANYEIAE